MNCMVFHAIHVVARTDIQGQLDENNEFYRYNPIDTEHGQSGAPLFVDLMRNIASNNNDNNNGNHNQDMLLLAYTSMVTKMMQTQR